MEILRVSNATKYFGETRLFENLSFHIEEGAKAGLLGVNGAGKTSLFKVLTGQMHLDEGDIYIHPNAKIGYMKQNIEYNSEKSVIEEVMEEFTYLKEIEAELEKVRRELEKTSTDPLIKKQDSLMSQYQREGGFEYKSRVRGALIGLGFTEKDFERKFKSLSGGEKTRLLLCRLLLGKYSLLLLDEPTNHLDIRSVRWLESFLKNYRGSYIIISHDRYFLDKTTNMTMNLSSGKITSYTGSYSDFIKKKEAVDAAKAKKYELQKKEIKRIEGIIQQQKMWNRERNIKCAESKMKMIERIASTMEKPEEAEQAINFSFNIKSGGANEVLSLKGVEKSFGENKVINCADMEIRKGERVFLLGDNGCGKTTLLKTILGQVSPDAGYIKIGNGIAIGYYEQQHMSLKENKTIYDEISDAYPFMEKTKIRNALAAFLFKNDDCFKIISSLSGGEKARVLLCKIMLSEVNFLILDEPTNHLDIFSKEALEDALHSYDGTILAVSHDRYFINSVADKIYSMKEGSLKCYNGNYDYFLEKTEESQSQDNRKTESLGGENYRKQKELASAKRKAENEVKKAEENIVLLEKKIKELEEKLFSPEALDIEKAMEWHNEKEKSERELEKFYELWEEWNKELNAIN